MFSKMARWAAGIVSAQQQALAFYDRRRPGCAPQRIRATVCAPCGGSGCVLRIEAMNSVSSVLLDLWCAQNLFSTCAAVAFAHGLPRPEKPGTEPNVAIIVPIKGDANLSRFLALLRAQSYSRYRVVAAVESEKDPAFQMLAAAALQPGASIEIAVAGLAQSTGQKVWNQLAALDELRADDEIVAFLDADTLPTPLWLPRLVAAVTDAGRSAATGYRWMVPADDRLSSSCLAAANASIATLPRSGLPPHLCWGGSVAMRRSTLEAIKLRDYWRGAVSDDLQMTAALRRSGVVLHTPRQGLVLSPVSCSWRELVAFGVRQHRLVWLHEPWTWAIALLCLWAPPIAIACALPSLTSGSPRVWAVAGLIAILGEVRTRARLRIQRALWPDIGLTQAEKVRWRVDRLLRPAWWLLHALCAAAAPLSRTIDWAGVRYRVKGPQSVTADRSCETT
jgi:hypothetical protein